MDDIAGWNARARWCLAHAGELEARAKRRLGRWRQLLEAIPPVAHEELYAAAHHGLLPGTPATLVTALREGCLTMAGGVGEGKTTAAAWRCYTADESVLWLDAARVALGRSDDTAALLAAIPTVGLVVLDDVGAPGTTGQWEAPKVAMVLTAIAGRHRPSIVTTNLDTRPFGEIYDGGPGGRVADRLRQAPHLLEKLPISKRSRRETSKPAPRDLPPSERAASLFLQQLGACRETSMAMVMHDADPAAVLAVAKRLDVPSVEALDDRVRAHNEMRVWMAATIADLTRAKTTEDVAREGFPGGRSSSSWNSTASSRRGTW